MDELLRLLGIDGSMFPEHGMQVGDRVRMVNLNAHTFKEHNNIMVNGEEGVVVNAFKFNGIMPVFEVRPDNGKTAEVRGQLLDRLPFGCAEDFSSVIKIEE